MTTTARREILNNEENTMDSEIAYTDSPNVLGLGLTSDRDRSIIEIRIEGIQKEINNLGEEAHRLLDRIKPVRRLQPTVDSELNSKDLAPEHASDMALRLAQISQQANYIGNLIRVAIDELEI
jgi:selenocysteine lyase/cysteine desulfurase